MSLEDKVAIVTGAGDAGPGGLGVHYAAALAQAGAAVTVADIDGAGAERIAKRLADAGHKAIGVCVDVANEAEVKAMVAATIKAFGGVDILVNNAGLARDKWNEGVNLPTEDWMRILAVNTLAPLVCARACRDSMKARGGGAIVNQSSSAAFDEYGAYSVTKMALVGMTNILSKELAPDGIRVNAIAPGVMTGKVPPDVLKMVLAQQKVTRQGKPQDLIGALLYLCSDASSFVTGITIRVDGGVTRGRL